MHLSASSTWASLGPVLYSLLALVLVSSFDITSWDMSTLLHSRSDIVCLAYSRADWGALGGRERGIKIDGGCGHMVTHLLISIFFKQVSINSTARGQLSLLAYRMVNINTSTPLLFLTISSPLQSILSWVSGREYERPAYLFLAIIKKG